MIKKIPIEEYERIITHLEFGGSVAEADNLLEHAKIETSAFTELLRDQVDLIMGCKGAGKTALFRLLNDYLKDWFLDEFNTILINGADEPKGEPIFRHFYARFEEFSEEDFENFWKIYFVYLLNQQLFQSPTYKKQVNIAKSQINKFKTECEKLGIPFLKGNLTLLKIVNEVYNALKQIKSLGATTKTDGSFGATLEFHDSKQSAKQVDSTPIFINELMQIVRKILATSNLRVWILMDRLDEVFERRSSVERLALRSLLKCIPYFNTEHTRLKLFLRDDIYDSITEGGFTALTHVTSRSSENLNWSTGEILHLIVKRAALNTRVKSYYDIEIEEIDKNQEYRKEVFYKLFPLKVKSGKNQPTTIEWLCRRCKDGKGTVAPRDIIDLLQAAKRFQETVFRSHQTDQGYLLSGEALSEGFIRMSKNKRDRMLKAEFPNLSPAIRKFENGRAEHTEESLVELLGVKWEKEIKRLEAIGFIKKEPKRKSYVIPFIYRPCFNIKQGKAPKNHCES